MEVEEGENTFDTQSIQEPKITFFDCTKQIKKGPQLVRPSILNVITSLVLQSILHTNNYHALTPYSFFYFWGVFSDNVNTFTIGV